MSAAYEQTLDAFRAAVGLDADAPIEAVMNELRSMPQPVVLLAIEVALGLLDDSAFCTRSTRERTTIPARTSAGSKRRAPRADMGSTGVRSNPLRKGRTMTMLHDDDIRCVYHRDGSVSWWSVYTQTWHRTRTLPPDQDMAAMNAAERRRIALHLAAAHHEGSPAAERYLASIRTVRHA